MYHGCTKHRKYRQTNRTERGTFKKYIRSKLLQFYEINISTNIKKD